jgi:hypothetical protein
MNKEKVTNPRTKTTVFLITAGSSHSYNRNISNIIAVLTTTAAKAREGVPQTQVSSVTLVISISTKIATQRELPWNAKIMRSSSHKITHMKINTD